MNSKKVLIFHPALAPYRVDFFNSIADNFNSKFYFFKTNLENQKFNQDKLKQEVAFQINYLDNGVNLPGRSIRWKVLNIISDFEPDIVICPEFNILNVIVGMYKLITRKKISIVTLCDDYIVDIEHVSTLRKLMRGIQMRFLNGIIVTTNEVESWFKVRVNNNCNLFLMPIVTKESKFRKKLKNSISLVDSISVKYDLTDKHVFLFVGRLVAVKNLEFLIHAFKTFSRKNNNAVLFIVGSGVLHENLLKIIEFENLQNNIYLVGRFEGEKLLAWYQISDCFVLPSIYEPFGAVTNEALISGCFSLISSNAGSSSLIKQDLNGKIFNPNSREELVLSMQCFIDQNDSLKDRNKLRPSLMLNSFEDYIDSFINYLNSL